MEQKYLTLGIETSCDETAAAVYDSQQGLLSSIISSQIDIHKRYGGVIPELASRSQLEKINPVIEATLAQAGKTLDDIDVIAVTNRPGLPGSLLVGVCFAKALAWAKQKKIIGINHLEGHTFSPFLEHNVPFPHIALTASGGHTNICWVQDLGVYEIIGTTQDDAAGEAFDKIAKLLELSYPGGPEIEKHAQSVGFEDFFHYPRLKNKTLDFSFSGLKTAVLYDLVKRGAYDMSKKKLICQDDALKNQVASSLLVCIADIFVQKITLALQEYPQAKAITFAGGVACNKYIRQRINTLCQSYRLPLFIPSPLYCTDNGAMIAFVGNYKARQHKFDNWNLNIL